MAIDQTPRSGGTPGTVDREHLIAERLKHHVPLSRDEYTSETRRAELVFRLQVVILFVFFVAAVGVAHAFFADVQWVVEGLVVVGVLSIVALLLRSPQQALGPLGLSLVIDQESAREAVLEWAASSEAVSNQLGVWRANGVPITMREHDAIATAIRAGEAHDIEAVLGPRPSP